MINTALIDAAVGVIVFVLGMGLTIRRFGVRNRIALTVVAICAPIVAVFAVIQVAFLIIHGRTFSADACPPSLETAEQLVEVQRQAMFGGPLRVPSFTTSWKLAYERAMQKDAERVRRLAQRYLTVA